MMVEKVTCKLCGFCSENTVQGHISKKHKIKISEYCKRFPGVAIYTRSYTERFKEKLKSFMSTPEYRAKLSKTSSDMWKDPAKREERSRVLKKAQNSDKAKINHSLGAKRHFDSRTPEQAGEHRRGIIDSWKDPDKRSNRVEVLKRSHSSPEVRKKHSDAVNKYHAGLSPENREKVRNRLRDVWAVPENREKILECAMNGLKKMNTPEIRDKIRRTNLTPETKDRRSIVAVDRMLKVKKISGLNKLLEDLMLKAGLIFESEYPIYPYLVDFCFPELKIVVEADGDYWHCNPKYYSIPSKLQKKVVDKDRRERTFFSNKGWTLLRFWETDLKKDPTGCLGIIKETVKNATDNR